MAEAVGGVLGVDTIARPDDFRVTRIRALRGPNFWRLAPVIACDVSLGTLDEIPSVDLPGFNERLTQLLPTLHEHECTRGAPGGFVQRLHEGTLLPHILEHIALELQILAGTDVGFGRVVASGDAGVWWVIVAYEEEAVGLRAVHEAVQIIRACMTGEDVDASRLIGELQQLWQTVRLGPSTDAIVEEARRRHSGAAPELPVTRAARAGAQLAPHSGHDDRQHERDRRRDRAEQG
jgi:cyanophycin synthetase